MSPRKLLLLGFLALTLLLPGCDSGDDDDDTRTIPPPEGCSSPALANVSFTFHIHFDGEDYPQAELLDLMAEVGADNFSFPFYPAVITELGADPDSNRLAVTFTDATPPKDEEERGDDDDSANPEDPNYVRIVYELPLGYELPVELDQSVASYVGLDTSTGSLIAAFGIWEEVVVGEETEYKLLFMAEPSDLGMFFMPGPFHPVFNGVSVRDRACPNLNALQCASTYNLSQEFEVLPEILVDEKTGEETVIPGDSFELWPTEHRDFIFGELDLRVVNVWSFTHREINPNCSNQYDYSAERASYFVTRTASAPAR